MAGYIDCSGLVVALVDRAPFGDTASFVLALGLFSMVSIDTEDSQQTLYQ